MKSFILGSVLLGVLCAPIASATSLSFPPPESPIYTMGDDVSAYRERIDVPTQPIVVPTVVELPVTVLPGEHSRFLVFENETGRVVPSYFNEQYTVNPVELVTLGRYPALDLGAFIDDDVRTGVQFDLPQFTEGIVEFEIHSPLVPVQSSGLSFTFERNVSLPTTIEVRATDEYTGAERVVLAETQMWGTYVNFIPTRSAKWIVRLTYAQPLKINEVHLIQDDPEQSVKRSVRFLAQPEMSYTVYQNPDRELVSDQYYGMEQGDLVSDEGVLVLPRLSPRSSEWYIPADVDQDGIQDTKDNCVAVANPDQIDKDYSGVGDACEDFDRDGYMNTVDNCVNLPNLDQRDEDGDGIGDVCDAEESRFTERLPWVPWVGIGVATVVLLGLFVVVARRPIDGEQGSEPTDTNTAV